MVPYVENLVWKLLLKFWKAPGSSLIYNLHTSYDLIYSLTQSILLFFLHLFEVQKKSEMILI